MPLSDDEYPVIGSDDLTFSDGMTGKQRRQLRLERLGLLEDELEKDDCYPEYDDEDTGEKRLKREIQAEALRRLELAARTEEDFAYIIKQWDRIDRNRERRERDHEVLRGDIPLEYQAVPNPKIIPLWMNDPAYRQLNSGYFLDVLFDCPYEMHELITDEFLSDLVKSLSETQKEVLFFLALRLYSTSRVAKLRGQTARNIRKVRATIQRKLQRKLYVHLSGKEHLTLREKTFLEEYEKAQAADKLIQKKKSC